MALNSLKSAAQLAGSFTRQSAFTHKWGGTLAPSSQQWKNLGSRGMSGCWAGTTIPQNMHFSALYLSPELVFWGGVYPINRWTCQVVKTGGGSNMFNPFLGWWLTMKHMKPVESIYQSDISCELMRPSLGKNTKTETGADRWNLHDTDVAVPCCRKVDISKFQGRTRPRHSATYWRLLGCLVSLQFLILAGRKLDICKDCGFVRHHGPNWFTTDPFHLLHLVIGCASRFVAGSQLLFELGPVGDVTQGMFTQEAG